MTTRLWSGTSGFAYKEWKGSFYPDDAKDDELLAHYGRQLAAVEINSTFYRMPRADVLSRWVGMVPESFVFVLKAPRRITHQSRLSKCEDSVSYLWRQAQALGPHLGPILFQFPPNFRVNVERLQTFVSGLPDGMRAAFEFRHESWSSPEVHEVLTEGGCAWCVADDDDGEAEMVSTADWGYARLRREVYSEKQLEIWVQRFRDAGWSEVFCFFKHEDGSTGPAAARRIHEISAR